MIIMYMDSEELHEDTCFFYWLWGRKHNMFLLWEAVSRYRDFIQLLNSFCVWSYMWWTKDKLWMICFIFPAQCWVVKENWRQYCVQLQNYCSNHCTFTVLVSQADFISGCNDLLNKCTFWHSSAFGNQVTFSCQMCSLLITVFSYHLAICLCNCMW